MIRTKEKGWKILFAVGLLPFLAVLLTGVYAAITGFSGLAILGPTKYGIEAFMEWIVLYSFLYWPTYVIGMLCMVGALVWKRKRERDRDGDKEEIHG